MASAIATTRLRKELSKLHQDPPPGIIAEPKESDILTWFYALQGPPDTPFADGIYVGKLKFPPEYPNKPPSIFMSTPSGRFETNTRLCLSMSDFHPESWNAMWSVASILQGIRSFMAGEELTTGGIQATAQERVKLAQASRAYNAKHFGHLFDGDMAAAFDKFEQARLAAAAKQRQLAAATNHKDTDGTEEPLTTATTTSKTTAGRGIRGRRPARRHTRKTSQQREIDPVENEEEETPQDHDQGETNSDNTNSTQEAELTPEEIEKRRKKNAKKRAKQKAKKTVCTAQPGDNEDADCV